MSAHSPLSPGEVTRLLDDWSRREPEALDRLVPVVLDELRRLAQKRLAQYRLARRSGPGDHTLEPTAIVNEVYLRLVGVEARGFENRNQFFALSSRLMRDVLVDHARASLAQKRGGDQIRVELAEGLDLPLRRDFDLETLLTLDQALEDLEEVDPTLTRLVELRFFGGLTMAESAQVLGVSLSTAERTWRIARRRLARELKGSPQPAPPPPAEPPRSAGP